MELPQDLIEEIIDEIHAESVTHPDVAASFLKSCALVAPSFLHQSQKHLFSRIELQDGLPASPLRFSELLSRAPHLAEHVRNLTVECNSTNWVSVAHILSAVSKRLTHLKLSPKEHEWYDEELTPRIRAPFQEPFPLPRLRAIELCNYEISDVIQFQALFDNCAQLDSLELSNIVFLDFPSFPAPPTPARPTTALSTLTIKNMTSQMVDSIIDSFTVLDIKHLQTLHIYDTPILNLLRMKGRSIQYLRISVYYMDLSSLSQSLAPSHLEGANLRSLILDVHFPMFLPLVLAVFGDIANLKRLEMVGIGFTMSVSEMYHDQTTWTALDAVLQVLLEAGNALRQVTLSIGPTDSSIPALIRAWMPSLDRKGVLKIITPGGIIC
ncbi:hypothetical protein FB451DRAFT_1289559 [Mycena latifolia]|nr:hypothetical protein FB451DRAFT_1289559 [Mycena latifolia]